ncbi:OmpH family outer membrane protein [Flaviaesturariibacter flavus]|uniref:OmpH family outer membrane protein n=1 Tax=Flaviaesturariibacter flavus TaxID=2502780 RepID=A0A4R1BJX9_9BACT|nr:OmpH family outer membrane protein [Flaviaesturariibacter flavus]TCJ17606.1 OmpH family outer membrane protein [Flaviaesturariibacter flavus]
MKNGLLVLNLVLLVAVGVLFWLHFSKPAAVAAANLPQARTEGGTAGQCRIAYFEMDSIENAFSMVKDVKSELDRKEGQMRNELGRMEKEYRNKAQQYQAQAVNMNQTQSELAQRDMLQTQQVMQSREQQLKQEYQDLQMRKLQDVRSKIEAFLKEYNRNGAYSYIVSYEPGLIFFKDSAYNITGDLIKGLNAEYKTAATKK